MPSVQDVLRTANFSSRTDFYSSKQPNVTVNPLPNTKIFFICLMSLILLVALTIVLFCYLKKRRVKRRAKKLSLAHKLTTSGVNTKYPLKRLRFIEKLGEGAFGVVYKAEAPDLLSPNETTTVAAKVLRECDRTNKDKVIAFGNEAAAISAFFHQNVIRLLGICSEGNCNNHKPGTVTCLLFEYMDGGDLCAFLRSRGPSKTLFGVGSCNPIPYITDAIKLSISTQIACGMKYLSERKFIHRDLATRNCLVSFQDFVIKISDFGMSRRTYESDYYTSNNLKAVPIRWMSPETILYSRYSSQSDVWAFGVTLWEIYTFALRPYYFLSNEEVVASVTQGEILTRPADTPDWMYNLMKLCWDESPDERPSFAIIYSVLETISLNNGNVPVMPSSSRAEGCYEMGDPVLSQNIHRTNTLDGVSIIALAHPIAPVFVNVPSE